MYYMVMAIFANQARIKKKKQKKKQTSNNSGHAKWRDCQIKAS